MTTFIRKNIVVCTVTFTAVNGSPTQPSAATLVLTYKNQIGAMLTTSLSMMYNNTAGAWVAEWDSSAAGRGTVFWMAYGYGQLQAATEGQFDIEANSANTI